MEAKASKTKPSDGKPASGRSGDVEANEPNQCFATASFAGFGGNSQD